MGGVGEVAAGGEAFEGDGWVGLFGVCLCVLDEVAEGFGG